MNKFTIDIPNKIKQPGQCCVYCGKSYKLRSNLNKHASICELVDKSKKKTFIIEEDEEANAPSQKTMYKMLIELASKYNKLDQEMREIKKWVVTKKKKINVLEWLNNTVVVDYTFEHLNEQIIICEQDIENIFQLSFVEALHKIFDRTIYQISYQECDNLHYPIIAFTQKNHKLYGYSNDGNEKKWQEITSEHLIKFLNKVYIKYFKAFSEWKRTNAQKIAGDDDLSTRCDKTTIKFANVDFKQEVQLSKIKTQMYNNIRIDLKAMIEYELEF